MSITVFAGALFCACGLFCFYSAACVAREAKRHYCQLAKILNKKAHDRLMRRMYRKELLIAVPPFVLMGLVCFVSGLLFFLA